MSPVFSRKSCSGWIEWLGEKRDYALHRKPLDLIQSFLAEKHENSQWEKKHPSRPENRVACFDLQERKAKAVAKKTSPGDDRSSV
ncbi:uncharacterized protein NPIL_340351 [Nephila pilipes]|uniref:Uncharacterized protein n=1 Tax=Nephila pilipes TaxID=299642 RepID=A0A8X6NJD2_NEPPI|nr:uncharacterized protein NPIL_340351 [Nephila pilipes]